MGARFVHVCACACVRACKPCQRLPHLDHLPTTRAIISSGGRQIGSCKLGKSGLQVRDELTGNHFEDVSLWIAALAVQEGAKVAVRGSGRQDGGGEGGGATQRDKAIDEGDYGRGWWDCLHVGGRSLRAHLHHTLCRDVARIGNQEVRDDGGRTAAGLRIPMLAEKESGGERDVNLHQRRVWARLVRHNEVQLLERASAWLAKTEQAAR